MSGTIRPYVSDDLDAVMDVWRRGSRAGHPFLSEETLDAMHRVIVEECIPVADQWVYAEDEVVVGFIAMVVDTIGALFVVPEAHGRGIGTALMEHVAPSHDHLELGVYEPNAAARAFYASRGFVPTGKGVCKYTGVPELYLRRERQS